MSQECWTKVIGNQLGPRQSPAEGAAGTDFPRCPGREDRASQEDQDLPGTGWAPGLKAVLGNPPLPPISFSSKATGPRAHFPGSLSTLSGRQWDTGGLPGSDSPELSLQTLAPPALTTVTLGRERLTGAPGPWTLTAQPGALPLLSWCLWMDRWTDSLWTGSLGVGRARAGTYSLGQ